MKPEPHRSKRFDLMLCVIEHGRKRNCPKGATVAEVGKDITFETDILDTYDYKGWKPVHYDLLMVSAAVEFADRCRVRGISQWSRSFWISVPVLELETWRRREVQDSLRATLRHLTGDNWQFSFVEWKGTSTVGFRQRQLPLGSEKKFVIAYSDGLDSRCVASLCGPKGSGLRVRVTKNKNLLKKGEEPFDQIPFRVHLPPKKKSESSVRSRGFKFAAITAIVAQLVDLNRIVVPESGQGALGPVLLPLHNIYPDYRNHPTYFRRMERFIDSVLGHSVHYAQPRLWSTKGDTIAAYRNSVNRIPVELFNTRSCWQRRFNAKIDGKLGHCGLCVACLLRRMSMHAADIKEPDNTYAFADLTAPQLPATEDYKRGTQPEAMVQYGSVGARHLQQLANIADLPDDALQVHAFEVAQSTEVSQQDTMKNLRKMLLTHAHEWRAFMSAQGEQSFMKSWTEGGRYGRP